MKRKRVYIVMYNDCQGSYEGKKELKNRALKTEKLSYNNQDIERIIFGTIQE